MVVICSCLRSHVLLHLSLSWVCASRTPGAPPGQPTYPPIAAYHTPTSAAASGAAASSCSKLHSQDLYSLPVIMARMEASLVRKPDPIVMEAHVRTLALFNQHPRLSSAREKIVLSFLMGGASPWAKASGACRGRRWSYLACQFCTDSDTYSDTYIKQK